MGPIRRFLNCSHQEKQLFFRALPWVLAVRLGLLCLPFRTVARRVLRVPTGRTRRGSFDPSVRPLISWATGKANEVVPGRGTCLHEALAGHVLLRRSGFEPVLKVGVRRDDDGELLAHAWVEEGDKVIIGGTRRRTADYSVFPDLERITTRLSVR